MKHALAAWVLTASLAAAGEPVVVPSAPLTLFNGKDLSAFYTWIPPYGHQDPHGVFRVVDNLDGAPAIRISGEDNGGLITRRDYADYRLVAEFRWGVLTWGKRMRRARDSGILVHCFGEDGDRNATFTAPYLGSIEVQVSEGTTGDYYLLAGYQRGLTLPIAPKLTVLVGAVARRWDPDGTPQGFDHGLVGWRFRDPHFRDVIGFRGARDAEKPLGEWNRIEVICRGGDIDCRLNGEEVNRGTNGTFNHGKLLFQSESAEIYYRGIELLPLNP